MPLPPSLARSARVSECQAPGRGEYSLHLTQQGTPRMGQLKREEEAAGQRE